MEILVALVLIGPVVMLFPYILGAFVTVLGIFSVIVYAICRLLGNLFKR